MAEGLHRAALPALGRQGAKGCHPPSHSRLEVCYFPDTRRHGERVVAGWGWTSHRAAWARERVPAEGPREPVLAGRPAETGGC